MSAKAPPHPNTADKSGEFYVRGPRIWRLGFRVWRAHSAQNLKKGAWLLQAIVDKLRADEKRLPYDASLPPLPETITDEHLKQP